MKFFKVVLMLLLISNMLKAQESITFYEHYTGLISEDLKLTADLIRSEDSFTGFYYYQFKEGNQWITSKPIALDGQVDEKNHFVLNEFGGNSSFFRGVLESSKLIKGEWINEHLKEPVSFTLKATYPSGTLPLHFVGRSGCKYFEDLTDNPKASFQADLLFPPNQLDEAIFHQLLQKIYYYIGFRGDDEPNKDIITQLEQKFFDQFHKSLQNVALDSFPEQFNWIKNIRVGVINNEASLLCLQFETYAKTGSRPGTNVRKYLVFDIKENKLLKLEDIFQEEQWKDLQIFLQKRLMDHYRISPQTSLTDAGFFQDTIPITSNFYIHHGGIGFYYNVFEVAPQSNGSTDIFIPWKDVLVLLREGHPIQQFLQK